MQFSSLLKLNKYKMPIPLQPLITLPLYDRPDTYIKTSIFIKKNKNEKNVKAATYIYIRNISIQGKERNVKPPQENKNKFRRTARRTVI
jgi:hypothetical protein